jgi:hypothetical protein
MRKIMNFNHRPEFRASWETILGLPATSRLHQAGTAIRLGLG